VPAQETENNPHRHSCCPILEAQLPEATEMCRYSKLSARVFRAKPNKFNRLEGRQRLCVPDRDEKRCKSYAEKKIFSQNASVKMRE
jgi:hypothetical protein